jgi:hypothetical protein
MGRRNDEGEGRDSGLESGRDGECSAGGTRPREAVYIGYVVPHLASSAALPRSCRGPRPLTQRRTGLDVSPASLDPLARLHTRASRRACHLRGSTTVESPPSPRFCSPPSRQLACACAATRVRLAPSTQHWRRQCCAGLDVQTTPARLPVPKCPLTSRAWRAHGASTSRACRLVLGVIHHYEREVRDWPPTPPLPALPSGGHHFCTRETPRSNAAQWGQSALPVCVRSWLIHAHVFSEGRLREMVFEGARDRGASARAAQAERDREAQGLGCCFQRAPLLTRRDLVAARRSVSHVQECLPLAVRGRLFHPARQSLLALGGAIPHLVYNAQPYAVLATPAAH